MNLNELYRLICNLARIGTVLEVDTEKYLARVETGENKTDWIRWAVPRAGEAVTWWAPTVGEQVIFCAPAVRWRRHSLPEAFTAKTHRRQVLALPPA